VAQVRFGHDSEHRKRTTLSLHGALPISYSRRSRASHVAPYPSIYSARTPRITATTAIVSRSSRFSNRRQSRFTAPSRTIVLRRRSEEHTSALQSRVDLVCRLLLEKTTTH